MPYKNVKEFIEDLNSRTNSNRNQPEVAASEALTCYRGLFSKLADPDIGLHMDWCVANTVWGWTLVLGVDAVADCSSEMFQIVPSADQENNTLNITTPSSDPMIQRWPRELLSESFMCTRRVKKFSELSRAINSWIRYRARMLNLKSKHLLMQLNKVEVERDRYQRFIHA